MEKTSIVNHIQASGTWESKYGTMYKFEVGFSNGDVGDYNSKSKDQTSFKLGEETTYDISTREVNGKLFYTVKPVKAPFVPFASKPADPDKDKKIARMSVLKSVTDLVVSGHIKFDNLFEYAKYFEAYVESGVNPFFEMLGKEFELKAKKITKEQREDLPF
ncbi:MAG: hypothetical protein ACO239_06660 [Sediminibacterium sp.]|jgi:hypothetical protein